MKESLEKLLAAVEAGKVDKKSPYPPQFKDQDGSFELTKLALEKGCRPDEILEEALIPAMANVGNKFSRQEIYVPQMLMSAKAMSAAMTHIKPFFLSGETKRRGTFLIGTVTGDLHDIGKNLVAMMIEGAGWEVIDLGVDVKREKLLEEIEKHPGCTVGLSALLTTTMVNMEMMVHDVKEKYSETKVLVGGAPLSMDFCRKIGADHYSADPQGAVDYLNKLIA
ncbi:MAG: cobalamin-dependent protein [Bacteroidales bacterium]|nr:cobalamin-dependent protein [Bacteroidales bacterium]